MPSKAAARRAEQRKREGKAPTTQAGEFVREEMHHAKEGRHSVKNPKQAIAIGLSQARRAGVDVKPPKKGKANPATRKKAQRDYERGAQNRKRTAKRTASTSKRASSAAKRTSSSSTRGARKSAASTHSTRRRTAAKAARKKTSAGRAPAKRKAAARKSR